VVWLWRLKSGQQLLAGSLSLILAGAVGNLWDRVEYGYVVDFLSFHYQQAYFPAFNVADSAITIGAVLMIIDMLINPDNKKSD
jgi:signal peptidase II